MLIIKILIVVIIAILLRRHLAFFKPHWPVIVGFMAGAVAGWSWGHFLIKSGTHIELLYYLGRPQSFAKPLFAIIGALVTVKPVSTAIRELFPRDQEKDENVRGQ